MMKEWFYFLQNSSDWKFNEGNRFSIFFWRFGMLRVEIFYSNFILFMNESLKKKDE
jgi:hypothetical protein